MTTTGTLTFEPVGGPWRKGEVLFFADARSAQESLKEEWEDFFLSLMRSGDNP